MIPLVCVEPRRPRLELDREALPSAFNMWEAFYESTDPIPTGFDEPPSPVLALEVIDPAWQASRTHLQAGILPSTTAERSVARSRNNLCLSHDVGPFVLRVFFHCFGMQPHACGGC